MSEKQKPSTESFDEKRKRKIEKNLSEIEDVDFEVIETPDLQEFKSYRRQSEAKFASSQTAKLQAYREAEQKGMQGRLPILTKKSLREIQAGRRQLQDEDVYTSRIDYNEADTREMRELLSREDAERGLDNTFSKAKAVERLFVTYLNNSQFFALENETIRTRQSSDFDDLKNGIDIYSIIEGQPDEEGRAPSLIIAFDITSAKIPEKLSKKLTKIRMAGDRQLHPGESQITYYAKPGENDPDKQQREFPKNHVIHYTLSLGDQACDDVLFQTEIDENGLTENGIDKMPDLKLKFLLQIQAQNYYYLAATEREIEELEESIDDYPFSEYIEDEQLKSQVEETEEKINSANRWKHKLEKMIAILEDSIHETQKGILTSDLPATESTIRYILKKPEGPLTQDEVRAGVSILLKEIQSGFTDEDESYSKFTEIAKTETKRQDDATREIQMRRRAKQLGTAIKP